MVKIKGELYDILIEPLKITITPISVPSLPSIIIYGTENEDFSIFNLGPAIINHIAMQTGNCIIGSTIYEKTCLVVDQKPGQWIMFDINQPRSSKYDPIDSGQTIHIVKEYIMKYE